MPDRLAISASNDPLESDADRISNAVMRAPDAPADGRTAPSSAISRSNASPNVAPGRDGVSARAPRTATADLPFLSDVFSTPGQPLDAATRGFFEPRFGNVFSDVRVHRDASAAATAEAIGAEAFTYGNHIGFGKGRYDAGTLEGKRLIAHELAHVTQARAAPERVWRKPKAEVVLGEPEVNPADAPAGADDEQWEHVEVVATGMDAAAKILADEGLTFTAAPLRENLFVGLHPKFIKIYDRNGASRARIALKEIKGLTLNPGVYIQLPQGLVALTRSSKDPTKYSFEGSGGASVIGQRKLSAKEVKERDEKAKKQGDKPAATKPGLLDLSTQVAEPEKYRTLLNTPPNALVIFFVPAYEQSSGGKEGGEKKGIYASPIEGRSDGEAANAPPWPVTVDGPKLVPIDADPTYSAKVDWAANGNYSLTSQVISQVGESIHYRWEMFDITQYAKKVLATDPAATRDDPAAKPEKTLDERVEEFKHAKAGAGTNVTGMGGANREFKREFEDWWKDNKRAAKGTANPDGDTVGEKLSNAAANRLALELAPVSLLTTAIGAAAKWFADLFAGPRQQQEIPLENQGIYLIRVITTPAIHEDREGKSIIRPPSVAAKVTEVAPMDTAVLEALDEPSAQLAELQAQIDLAKKDGNSAKAEYLQSLLDDANKKSKTSALDLLNAKRDDKQRDLDKFRTENKNLSDYSRVREIEMLDDQIALAERHEKERTAGAGNLDPMVRLNAALISEVTGEQYPLLVSAGPMAMDGSQYQWMISDVSNRDGDAFTGLGNTKSAAFKSALKKFGDKAAYGRGRIGVTTVGIGLEAGAENPMFVDSAPANWALAEKRLDDLVTTLAALGLIVASAGTAGALVGAGVAAARLIQRWQAGKLYLDAQTVSDVLGVLGGLGAASQVVAGLRVQKFEGAFALLQEGRATEQEIVAASNALKGAQDLARGVELANEAINYGGLVWGNLSFADQMMSINQQESAGAITHAAARRQRATAISSAVQNNGLFIAGNVLKAKHEAKARDEQAAKSADKPPAPDEAPVEKAPSKESGEREGSRESGGNAAKPAELPIGERRATLDELRAALPADLHSMLTIDETLHGDDVRAFYELDKTTGLISNIELRCGPDARPGSVALHVDTVRTMQKYQGFSGRVRQAISWVADIIGIDTLKPENAKSFEAALEIRKLPKSIDAQMAAMKKMEPNARDMAEAELDHLRVQLDQHLRALDLGAAGQAEGFVAAKGLSKAKQKQYAELRAKLRALEVGSDKHKAVRREMYELIGGDLPYATWEKVYTSNVERANKANKVVAAEHERLGWGRTEQTVSTGNGEVRRLDIANVKGRQGIEIKAYETGYISAEAEISWEVERDAKLVKRGWDIKWILIDTEPSGPLLKMLLEAGIIVERRTRKKGGESEFVSRNLPPRKK